MSKPVTSLANLIPVRSQPQPTPAPATVSEAPAARRTQPGRAKTVMIAGHFDPDVSYAIRELCGSLTRKQGQRVTVQQALAEALTLWFEKHGATPPDGLK